MLQVLCSCHTTSAVCLNARGGEASMGAHREQGNRELGTDSMVVTGHFLADVEMGPELQKQLKVWVSLTIQCLFL